MNLEASHNEDKLSDKELIIGVYSVKSGDRQIFNCSFNENVMIGFRLKVLNHVRKVCPGDYGGISITRVSDGWYVAGYGETAALATPTESGKSRFEIHNESGDNMQITVYMVSTQ